MSGIPNPLPLIGEAGRAGSDALDHGLADITGIDPQKDINNAAKDAAKGAASAAADAFKSALGNGYSLVFGNTTGLLGRILKVGLGVVMIIIGVSKMTGADNKVMQLASKVPVIPV